LNAKDAAAFLEAFKAYDAALVDYHAAREAYNRERGEIYDAFKADVLAELGLTGHPKADKVFDMAWDNGYDDGYADVLSFAEDYAELVL
jgi:hypothetical protein